MISSLPVFIIGSVLLSAVTGVLYHMLEKEYKSISNKTAYTGRRPYAPPVQPNQNN